MGFIFNYFPEVEFATKLIFGAVAAIIFLILAEILEVNHDYQDIKEVLEPIIIGLIITFVFIIAKRIMEII